jgi:hypothetical protein
MGRPRGTTKGAQRKPRQFRLSDAEWDRLQAAAEQSGEATTTWGRRVMLAAACVASRGMASD